MTATGVAVSLGLGTFSNCYCYPVPVKELLFSTTRIRNRSRKKRFGFGQKRFCVGAANANHEFDPELRSVLELATDSELYEIETILFGPRSDFHCYCYFTFIHSFHFSFSNLIILMCLSATWVLCSNPSHWHSQTQTQMMTSTVPWLESTLDYANNL